jgi:hypothetical protein
MVAMILTRAPQRSHFSMSIANTRFRRCAQLIRTDGTALLRSPWVPASLPSPASSL